MPNIVNERSSSLCLVKPASIEELVAVPNVTAIDWKQADAFGPGFEHKGGMSFTVMRLVPPFLLAGICALHVSAVNSQQDFLP